MTLRATLSICAVLVGLSPARASITSEDFVAVVAPSAAFIAAAGNLALAVSDDLRLREDARRQTVEAAAVLADLATWQRDDERAEAEADAAPTIDHLGPISHALSVPLEAIARTASAPAYPFTKLPSADRLGAAGQAELARLARLTGASFDEAYLSADIAALRRLESACRDFVLNGDDQALRALAVRALPKLREEIGLLGRR